MLTARFGWQVAQLSQRDRTKLDRFSINVQHYSQNHAKIVTLIEMSTAVNMQPYYWRVNVQDYGVFSDDSVQCEQGNWQHWRLSYSCYHQTRWVLLIVFFCENSEITQYTGMAKKVVTSNLRDVITFLAHPVYTVLLHWFHSVLSHSNLSYCFFFSYSYS